VARWEIQSTSLVPGPRSTAPAIAFSAFSYLDNVASPVCLPASMIRSLSLRSRSAAASRRASGELGEAFALVDPALLVEREPRAGPALEALARDAPADEPADERLDCAGADVVFALGVDSNCHAQAAAPSPPSNIHRGQRHPTRQSLLICISARSADAGRRQQQDGPDAGSSRLSLRHRTSAPALARGRLRKPGSSASPVPDRRAPAYAGLGIRRTASRCCVSSFGAAGLRLQNRRATTAELAAPS
jgi:hypothetical protein